MKILIMLRRTTRRGKGGLGDGALCCRVEWLWVFDGAAGRPSALSPDSRASSPSFLLAIARSPHFQRGNKSGVYGPGRLHCTPDGLLKGHITQTGHCSLRDAGSQRSRAGTGGLPSPTSSPPTQSASQPARLAERRLHCHPSWLPSKKP